MAGHTRRNIVFLALLFALGACAVAIAKPGGAVVGDTPASPGSPGLAQRGAVAKNGFPAWYKDQNGVRLEPCLDASNPLCIMGTPPDPNAPVTPDDVTGNFPDEFFYQAGNSGLDNVGATDAAGKLGKASLVASLEGAFFNGPPELNQQMVFARLRLKVTSGLKPDTDYTFVHPYGERTIHTDPGEDNLFVTEDIGAAAGAFDDALKGRIAPFLKWDPSVDPQAPDGYIGDPNVDHPITGGVNNYFAIIGPGVGANKLSDGTQACHADAMDKTHAILGPGATQSDCIETDLFSLMGKKAENAGVDVKRSTFSRDADGNTSVDILADSDADQTIVVQDPKADRRHTSDRLFPTTKMVRQDGKYYAHVTMPTAKSFPSPTDNQVEVVNGTDGAPQATKDVTPIDEILEPTATYTTPAGATQGKLVVTAKSSDQFAGDKVLLSVDNPAGGTPVTLDDTGTATLDNQPMPPATVTITSSKGATLDVPVHLDVNGPATDSTLTAYAGKDVKTSAGQTVKLFGTGSAGNVVSYHWTGPFAVDATTKAVDTAATVDGAAVTAASADTDTATLTAPDTPGEYGYQLTVTDDHGATSSDTMVLTVGAGGGANTTVDVLTPGKARFQASAQRLVIDGVAAVTSAHRIELWFSPTIKPGTTPDAIATVDPVDGSWAFDTGRGGMPSIPACSCVSYISELGDPASTDIGTNADVAAGTPHEVWNNIAIDNTAIGGGGGGGGRGAAVPVAAAAAVPLVGAATPVAAAARVAALAGARLAAPATATVAAFAATGVPVTVTVPAGATLVRLRLVAGANRTLLQTFKKANGPAKVKVRIRSAKLRTKLRAGKRYVIEVRAGTARNRLGKPTRKVIRIRR